MTENEETPAEPTAAPAEEPTQVVQIAETAQPEAFAPPAEPVAAAPAPAPAPAPVVEFAAPAVGIPLLPPSPEELAAQAAKKAKVRRIVAKSAVLAGSGVALIALLAVTGLQARDLTNKTADASKAAQAATSAGDLVGQLSSARSAAEGSILVDAGCIAVESSATSDEMNKLLDQSKAMLKASQGNDFATFTASIGKYVSGLQTFTTHLQQDAALSKRASVKNSINEVVGDLHTFISDMQTTLAGNYSDSVQKSMDNAGNMLVSDAATVDALCGGSVLTDGAGSADGSGGLAA